jgi:uncharacterized protein YecT (DUF1311 family)
MCVLDTKIVSELQGVQFGKADARVARMNAKWMNANLPFKLAVVFFGLGLMAAVGKEEAGGGVIECGGEKVVLFDKSGSTDGRYAIGWTLRAKGAGAKPVDWSLWDPDHPYDLLDKFDYLDPEITGGGLAPLVDAMTSVPREEGAGKRTRAPYELYDCVVDLKKKRLLALRSTWPYWPNKNHGDLQVIWSAAKDGRESAIVSNEARFSTANIWLVTTGESGMKGMELADRLDDEVTRVIKVMRPLSYRWYGISWLPEGGDAKIFEGSRVRLSYSADIPKSDYETVAGEMTVDVDSGRIEKEACGARRDDPFHNNAELARADKELNTAYAELVGRLKGTELEALKKEERDWLAKQLLGAEPPQGAMGDDAEADNEARDTGLIKAWKVRVAELRERLRGG